MKKLTLDVNALAVESFETDHVEGAGTVLGHQPAPAMDSTGAEVCLCTVRGCTPTQ